MVFQRMKDVTLILQAVSRGEKQATEELLPLVYNELRNLAAARMARESAGHTLQPTALVHEAWLRLIKVEDQTWQNRAHFFGAAAEAMRRILVEHARRKAGLKRGGGQQRLNVEDLDLAAATPDEKLLLINEALEELERVRQSLRPHAGHARAVSPHARVFGGEQFRQERRPRRFVCFIDANHFQRQPLVVEFCSRKLAGRNVGAPTWGEELGHKGIGGGQHRGGGRVEQQSFLLISRPPFWGPELFEQSRGLHGG